MGLIFLIMLGAVLGWLATIILRIVGRESLKVNVVAGIGGALIAGLVINPLLGEGNLLSGGYSAEALLISFAGSVLALISVNLLHCSEIG